MRDTRGITLIALIITIIVLLILTGISINLILGENGIIRKARETKEVTNEAIAREKLEFVLLDIQVDKAMDSSYNEIEYIDTRLEENGIVVNENIVIVNGWQFQIDRSVPEIVANLGKVGVETVLITTPYVGTSSFRTNISYIYNEAEIESYTYVIDDIEKTNLEKEYMIEGLEPETTHTVKVIAKYKNNLTVESNQITIKTEPRTYLYNNGDECIGITGGWKTIAFKGSTNATPKEPTLSNTDHMNVMLSTGSNLWGQGGGIIINNQIDYSQYRTVQIVYTASLTKYKAETAVQVWKNYESASKDMHIYTLCYNNAITSKTKSTVDISTDFNNFFIYLQAGRSASVNLNIYEVWLEK